MKYKVYVKMLQQFLKENPEAGDLEVITASDDEGNSFNLVHCSPTVGKFDGEFFRTITEEKNAICVN